VAASPRVSTAKRVRKGGGRRQLGKPYKIRGKWYHPREDRKYSKVGLASWYGPNFHGRLTANGEVYDQYGLSAAHPTFPLPSYARVTNVENGASVVVRVNDRGPYAHNRIIDMSAKAAKLLDYTHKGVTKVRVEYVGQAPLDGQDERYLLASYERGDSRFDGPAGVATAIPGVLLAALGPSSSAVNGRTAPLPQATLGAARETTTTIPRDRPADVNDGAVLFSALRDVQRVLDQTASSTRQEPTIVATPRLHDRFIIASFNADTRIAAAHAAAAAVFDAQLNPHAIEKFWKVRHHTGGRVLNFDR
jgi:rare lipoprotein A